MTNQKSKIAQAITGDHPRVTFVPDPAFYQQAKIKRKRFGQIYRGEISPSIDEVERIAEYFQIPVDKFYQTKKP